MAVEPDEEYEVEVIRSAVVTVSVPNEDEMRECALEVFAQLRGSDLETEFNIVSIDGKAVRRAVR